jgi:hypothetical protein
MVEVCEWIEQAIGLEPERAAAAQFAVLLHVCLGRSRCCDSVKVKRRIRDVQVEVTTCLRSRCRELVLLSGQSSMH